MSGKRFRELVLVFVAVLAASTAAWAQEVKPKDVMADAKWLFSSDEGKTFTLETLEVQPNERASVIAQVTFTVDDPSGVGGLFYVPARGWNPSLTLNEKALAGPIRRMRYVWFPMDPKDYLVKGKNVLLARGAVHNKGKEPMKVQIPGRFELVPPEMVGIQTGPILGAAGADFFTLTCRTNMPAAVTVTAEPVDPAGGEKTSAASQLGFYHRLRVPLAKGTRKFKYTVTSQAGKASKTDGPITVTVPGLGDQKFRFVAAGDCRSYPKSWAAVAAGMRKAEPEVVLFTGDLLSDGLWDWQWDVEFFNPAKAMLSSVPFYCAIGNHEHHAPVYFELMYSPGGDGKSANWSQTFGDVLLIGIDGSQNWGGNSPNGQWLEGVLKESKAKFIFLATHYPAYSSGPHGRRPDGGMAWSRKTIMPLLAKYNATAMIAGHDHIYERSEPPKGQGVTCIVSGGAGAPIYGRSAKNSFSKAFASKLHYCLFEINGDVCEMKVLEPNGKVIDQKTFEAREIPAAAEEKKAA